MTTLKQTRDSPAAEFELSRLLVRHDQPDEASKKLEQLRRGDPEAAEYWYWSARAARALGDSQRALLMEDRATRSRSRGQTPFGRQSERWYRVLESFGMARRQLAIQERMRARETGGLRALVDSTMQVQWYPAGVSTLAELDMQEGNPDSAIKRLEGLMADEGPNIDYYWRLGDAYAAANRADDAERAWLLGVQVGRGRHSDLSGLHNALSQWFERTRNDPQRSQYHLTASQVQMAIMDYDAGDYEEAAFRLEQCLEVDASLAQAWFYLGECRRLLSTPNPPAPGQTAADAYRKCLELKPNHGRALHALQLME